MTSQQEPAGPRWFAPALLAVTAVAIALRVSFALAVADDLPVSGDAGYFLALGEALESGEGYTVAAPGGVRTATATHPPALPAVLAVAQGVGLDTLPAQRVVLAFVSALGVTVLGVAGRRLAGPRAGLVAAAIAAVHPLWVQPAGMLMSESLYLVVVPGIVLLSARAVDRGSAPAMLAVGAAIGLAALTRSEAAALVVLLGAPLVWAAGRPRRNRLALGAALVVGAGLVLGPWVARNDDAFGTPTLSTNSGVTVAGSNCEETYSGDRLGGFRDGCSYAAAGAVVTFAEPGSDVRTNEASRDAAVREVGLDHARDHAGRLPVVLAARLGRTWGVFAPGDSLEFDTREGRSRSLQRVGSVLHLALLPVAVAGAVVVARGSEWWQRARWTGVAVMPVLVTVVGLAAYGSTRIRTGAEPSIALLAAVALVAAVDEGRRRLAR